MAYLVLAIGPNSRSARESLIIKAWTMGDEEMLESRSRVITRLFMSCARSHVLVRIRVSKPEIAILAYRMIEKMFDMIL